MKYWVIAVLAVALGALIGRELARPKPPPPADPVQVIVTELKTHAVVRHERQLAIWYKACPAVFGKTPEIFIAWPARLSYQLELKDVRVERHGDTLTVHTAAIQPDEPSVPTDFMDYLASTSIFTFANEQELVNHEIGKASPVARYLSTYFLANDSSLRSDFSDELRRLVQHLASALGVRLARIDVDVPAPQVSWPKLPTIELCAGTRASVNGVAFASYSDGVTVPIRFHPGSGSGIASVFGATPPARH
jgi:hypothetical protein